jgi:molybdopterin synthase catalytic subunit
MIEVTDKAISPEAVIVKVRSNSSGCVVTYVGSVRGHFHGELVLSVEYKDTKGSAEMVLQEISNQSKQK